jgi:ribulose-phosphate 3-epimerase
VARRLSPSILNADLARLAEEVKAIERLADWVHLDVMDNHFVPNLTFGAGTIVALRAHTDAFFDCHLMVSDPVSLMDELATAKTGMATMHVEALDDPAAALDEAERRGLAAGLALKPGTPLDTVLPYLDRIGLILPMTVEPGFGGQSFMDDQLDKIRAAREAIDASGRDIALEVDGGVNLDTIPACLEAGADTFVVGSAIFGAEDRAGAATAVRALIEAE